jgi:phosphoglycerate dehydrogenase-like enzyme
MSNHARGSEARKIRAAFIASPENMERVYGRGRREQIAERTALLGEPIPPGQLAANLDRLGEVEALFSTWGMPALTPEQIAQMPNLRVVFYGAGSVQGFARPLLENRVRVVSAWRVMANVVAQFTLGQILLSLKGYFRNVREYDGSPETFRAAHRGVGAYEETVALLGCGAVGRAVIGLLKPFDVQIIVFDPFLNEAAAQELGVEQVTIEEAFVRGLVVSNHLADKPETAEMINGDLLRRMRSGATLVNTARGRTVAEPELVEALRERPDLTALLDVTHPEPMGADNPLCSLPNVLVSTHIAGTTQEEISRLADLCIAEFDRYASGEPLEHEVTLEALPRLA